MERCAAGRPALTAATRVASPGEAGRLEQRFPGRRRQPGDAAGDEAGEVARDGQRLSGRRDPAANELAADLEREERVAAARARQAEQEGPGSARPRRSRRTTWSAARLKGARRMVSAAASSSARRRLSGRSSRPCGRRVARKPTRRPSSRRSANASAPSVARSSHCRSSTATSRGLPLGEGVERGEEAGEHGARLDRPPLRLPAQERRLQGPLLGRRQAREHVVSDLGEEVSEAGEGELRLGGRRA